MILQELLNYPCIRIFPETRSGMEIRIETQVNSPVVFYMDKSNYTLTPNVGQDNDDFESIQTTIDCLNGNQQFVQDVKDTFDALKNSNLNNAINLDNQIAKIADYFSLAHCSPTARLYNERVVGVSLSSYELQYNYNQKKVGIEVNQDSIVLRGYL